MASYATYTYYTNTYLGTAIASADFNHLALLASATIDQVTFNRAGAVVTAATDTALIDKIRMATCAIAEEMQAQEGQENGISSEGVGAHSVSYVEGSKKTLSSVEIYTNLAAIYLGSSGLMFKGFASGEYSGVLDET